MTLVEFDVVGAAEALGLNPRTLNNLRSRGGGPPFYKVSGRIRYKKADLEEWLQQRRRTSTSDRGAERQTRTSA